MQQLTKIQRFRFSEETVKKLALARNKSKFVREAIEEKLAKEGIKIKETKIKYPF